MSAEMKPVSFEVLLDWALREYRQNRSIFGVGADLFFSPTSRDAFVQKDVFGQYLATPIGPAAGPHTQLAQNIVCAWLCGGRFIEVKTVQVLDELEIPRPCIDMADEGYNVEWSQELRLEQSADEYIKAWVLIHVLHRVLGFASEGPVGTIFNLSVGYDLEGIRSRPVIRFLDRMDDASEEIEASLAVVARRIPELADLEIPPQISNNVCLSTMHGCPPEEIERIAAWLLQERRLHTAVKLNPTLLGRETVHRILQQDCGFGEISVPDSIFEHDLPWDEALELIRNLQTIAARRRLTFGVKLSNTLPTKNHRAVLPGEEMYMSGRTLFPLTVNLFARVAETCGDGLPVSFSGGADAHNVADLLAAGAWSVTAVTDVLKPGGYGRFGQYLENLAGAMKRCGAAGLKDLAQDRGGVLRRLAADSLDDRRYRRDYHPGVRPAVSTPLPRFDCIVAPCVCACPIEQDVPAYAGLIAAGRADEALEVILDRNPLPGINGYICAHFCQSRCTRSDYDESVAIRALKRFAFETGRVAAPTIATSERRVAIIGGGPSGLAAAACLAVRGVRATIFEAHETAGGMAAIAPGFRLPQSVVARDVARIEALGVEIRVSHPVTEPPESLLREGFDAVYIACGFQRDVSPGIEGLQGEGVFPALDFLARAARGEKLRLGRRVLVIGGGNTAMDAARTAGRLTGTAAELVYRRTREEMPAAAEEIEELLEEGNRLHTLASPLRVIRADGRPTALLCRRNELGEPDDSGRRRPVPIDGSEFEIEADSIIFAIGQAPDLVFLDGGEVSTRKNGAIAVESTTGRAGEWIYAGGDVTRGAATIVEACADGRRAAEAICARLDVTTEPGAIVAPVLDDEEIAGLHVARARKVLPCPPETLSLEARTGFDVVEQTFSSDQAREEAARCLQCSSVCDKCVGVCPNRANFACRVTPRNWTLPQLSCRDGELVLGAEEPFVIKQARQILHVDDFCNECGNCTTFCVHAGRPFADKARVFLTREYFERESDNAFFIEGRTVHSRFAGRVGRLSRRDETLEYTDEYLRLSLSPEMEIMKMELTKPFAGTFSLCRVAAMLLVFEGVASGMPFFKLD